MLNNKKIKIVPNSQINNGGIFEVMYRMADNPSKVYIFRGLTLKDGFLFTIQGYKNVLKPFFICQEGCEAERMMEYYKEKTKDFKFDHNENSMSYSKYRDFCIDFLNEYYNGVKNEER